MPDVIIIGSFALDGRLIVYLLAAVVGLGVIRLRLRSSGEQRRAVFDLAITFLLIIALFWKFAPVLFHPSVIWRRPLQVLFMQGTLLHVGLGSLVALSYVYYKMRRLRLPFMLFLDVLPFGFTAAMIVKGLLSWQYGQVTEMPWGVSVGDPDIHYHPLNIYMIILAVALLLVHWMRVRASSDLGQGIVLRDFLTGYGIGMFAISMLAQNPSGQLLSSVQIIYMLTAVLGVAIPYIIKTGNDYNT